MTQREGQLENIPDIPSVLLVGNIIQEFAARVREVVLNVDRKGTWLSSVRTRTVTLNLSQYSMELSQRSYTRCMQP